MKVTVVAEPGRNVLEHKANFRRAWPRGRLAIESGRVDLKPLVTRRFKLDDIEAAYDLFGHQRDGALKVSITP